MIPSISELAWVLADYQSAKVDPPARIVSHPDQTEGQMMSDDEISEYIKDSIATLRILSDKQSPQFGKVAALFQADMHYLVTLGRMDEDDYNDLTKDTNLRF